jgi:hypothetical protein
MRLSNIRLDPLKSVYLLRAYKDKVDIDLPLLAMTEPYDTVGVVTVVANVATVELFLTNSRMDPVRRKEFEDRLKALGVTKLIWERHRKTGEVQYKDKVL